MTSPPTRIVLLGGLRIERGTGPGRAGLSGRRSELVFAYLAAEHARAVSRDELADALWPDVLPDSWAPALRGVVSEVRRFLDDGGLDGHELLVGAGRGYQLRLPPGVTVDLDEARAALAQARAALAEGDPGSAASAADRAAALARLPFLPQHEGDWVDAIRAELSTLHSAALELAASAHAQAGDHRAATVAAERLVHAEPFGEAAHRLLITVLGHAGDRAGARRAYERCQEVLRAELGIEPSLDTEAALRAALAEAAPAPPPSAPAVQPGAGEAAFAAYSVLVVEDHDFQRRTTLSLLGRLGVGTLLEAPDGGAALDLLAAVSPPDVIVCDIDMPGMDGVEFIRHVARRGLASAVAIASGLDRRILDSVQAVGEGYGLQVLGAVEKPLTARTLGELLTAYRRPVAAPDSGAATRLSAAEIADGLAHGHVVSRFEPIADLGTGRIAAAEVVPRWQDPVTGAVAPASFAAALDAPEVTERFSDRVFDHGCDAARELAAAGVALDIVVRLPHDRLAGAVLADRLAEHAVGARADTRRIVLAIGAATVKGDSAVALDVLARLRVKGFGLWLDDFAFDAMPPARLEHVPLTGVRLPAALLASAATDPARAAALQEAVDLARTLGLAAVGTGCTGAQEFAMLLAVGAGRAQGPLVGEPMTAAALASWAEGWSPPSLVADDGP